MDARELQKVFRSEAYEMTPYLPGEEERSVVDDMIDSATKGRVCPLCHKAQITCVEEKSRSILVKTKHFCEAVNGDAEIKVTYLKKRKTT
jgi:hypothetical protein